MLVVALISDLMMQSQVSGAAARAGVHVDLVSSADALVAKAETAEPQLVVIDLSHPGLVARQVVEQLRAVLPSSATIMAFGPHVHKELLTAATLAGCDIVISRGQFHAQMAELLKGPG